MINWMAAWWQVRQSWSFLHHAYRCGLSLHASVANAWSPQRYAMTYAVAQVRPPRTSLRPRGF